MMEASLLNGALDALGTVVESALRWLNSVEPLRENLPGLARVLEQVEEAEDTSRRRLTLLLVMYSAVAFFLLWFFRSRGRGRGRLNLKYK